MRVRALCVSGKFWQQIATEGWEAGRDHILGCTKGLPVGAVFRGAFYQQWRGNETTPDLVFVFEHPDFEDVPDGEEIPHQEVVYKRWYEAEVEHGTGNSSGTEG